MGSITGGRSWLAGLLIVPALAGFLLLDAGFGLFMGMATAAAIIVLAARVGNDGPIEVADPGPGVDEGVLVLAVDGIDDTRTAGVVATVAEHACEGDAGVLVVSPARSGLLDRWADDLEGARFESQRALTISLATLAAAGVEAEGRVGDGDLIRAAEDALRSYAATEVLVVAAAGEHEREIGRLEHRLDRPLRRVEAAAPAEG